MSESAMNPESLDMGTAQLEARNVLDISVIRTLSKRADFPAYLQFFIHFSVIAGSGLLIWLAMPQWYLMIPPMLVMGFAYVTMFAPMHECVHRTAFNSRLPNEIFGWIAGLLSFYNFTYYRYYHTWHHRYTQDPEKDPELMTPKPATFFQYLVELTGIPFWFYRPVMFLKLASGKASDYPFVPEKARRNITLSAIAQLAVYLTVFAIGIFVWPPIFFFWFVPAILAQPFLRAILLAEHTGCSNEENGLTNTRTTLTNTPIKLLMWNMPFHTEHHLYPSIPFYRLPAAHQELKEKLAHLAPSYIAANKEIVEGFSTHKTEASQ
ncbi:MAG: fatty acid desaturase [Planctomycetaceae bacterium]